MFKYGLSKVYFGNGRVTSWDNSNYNPLRTKLIPSQRTVNRGYFTVGSTKDEVLAVQGTPDSFTDYMFKYGLSKVHFRNGRVIGWDNISDYNPLKVR